jgi:hypothetical protein
MSFTATTSNDTTMYKLGWGQLNYNQGVDGPLQWNNLQLDIVGFLAILGESAVISTSQVATLSPVRS